MIASQANYISGQDVARGCQSFIMMSKDKARFLMLVLPVLF